MKSRISKTNAIHQNCLMTFKKVQRCNSFSHKKDPYNHSLNRQKAAQMLVCTNGSNQETLKLITRDSVAIQTRQIYMLLVKNPQLLPMIMSFNNSN